MLTIKKSDNQETGTWWIMSGQATPAIRCPVCNHIAVLADHTISANGRVSPSVVCPDCGFHEFLTLAGWEGREIKPAYTKTVWCNSDRAKTRHFVNPATASAYANDLLRQGHQVRLRDYKPAKSYVDHVAENEDKYR